MKINKDIIAKDLDSPLQLIEIPSLLIIFDAMPLTTDLLVFILFAFFIAIQVFYYLFFFSRLAFYKKKNTELPTPKVPVSIIVCAFNEEANLMKNLPILLNQNYLKNGKPFFEVVVVNERFGVRLTDIITPSERIRKLNR